MATYLQDSEAPSFSGGEGVADLRPMLLPGYSELSKEDQAKVDAILGPPGEDGGFSPPFETVDLPAKLPLAWDNSASVSSIKVHPAIACEARVALEKVFKAGFWDKLIFGGTYVPRKARGGSFFSVHSWGVAVDLNPDENQLSWGRDRAQFAQPEFSPLMDIFEAAGFFSTGRSKNYEWGHFAITTDALLGKSGPPECRN